MCLLPSSNTSMNVIQQPASQEESPSLTSVYFLSLPPHHSRATIDLDRAWWCNGVEPLAAKQRGVPDVEVGEVEVMCRAGSGPILSKEERDAGAAVDSVAAAHATIVTVLRSLKVIPCSGEDYVGKMNSYLTVFNPRLQNR